MAAAATDNGASNPLREALRQRGGAAGSRRPAQIRRSQSCTQLGASSGGSRRGVDDQSDADLAANAPEGQAELKWLNLTAFAPKALMGALESFKTEDFTSTAKELGEQGFNLMQELSRPRQSKPKSKTQGRRSAQDGVLRSTLQGRGGIVLEDHLAAYRSDRKSKESPPEEAPPVDKPGESSAQEEPEVTGKEAAATVTQSPAEAAEASAAEAPAESPSPQEAQGVAQSSEKSSDSVPNLAPTDAETLTTSPDAACSSTTRGDSPAASAAQPAEAESSGLATRNEERLSSRQQRPEATERPSRPSWVKPQDDEDENRCSVTTPKEGRSSTGGMKDLREYWSKKSLGYAGQSENGRRRLSKGEAQAALQRLVSAGSAMDLEQVRELRKLAGGTSA
mmetsp:Transcript_62214/g.148431  ORF Transcript_62214/g.148431 Transcript_62214/m.148431 type:complete len:394 (-) Transcript_62214:25-1206(-)